MADDFSGITTTYNKPSGYIVGDQLVATIHGTDLVTTVKPLNLDIVLTDPTDGSSAHVKDSTSMTGTRNDPVEITGATDDLGHTYTVSADKQSVSTVA